MIADEILLASKSRFKRQLLENAGVRFDTCEPSVIEKDIQDNKPKVLAYKRAKAKSEVASVENPLSLTIGSDQTLEFDGRSFGKAETKEEAFERLKLLSGKTHFLHSAFVISWSERGSRQAIILAEKVVTARLTMRNLSDDEIRHYVSSSFEWQAVVGCYRYESIGIQFFSEVQGEYTTIVGLPLIELCDELRKLGVNPLLGSQGPWKITSGPLQKYVG
jgi:septum formation protein